MEHINWGLPVALDLFLAGLGAAAFLVAVMADLAGSKRYTSIRLAGAFIAPWPVILGVLLLVIDLGNPQRFWEMILKRGEGLSLEAPYIMFNPGSTMSWGTWLLSIFIIISLVYLVVSIISIPFSWGELLTKVVGIIGLPFALLVTTYTGVLISATANELWSSPLLPTVFVTSALSTGFAGIIFVLALLKMFNIPAESTFIQELEKLNGWVIGLLLIILALYVVLGIQSDQMKAIIGLKYGALFWVGIVGLGLVLPLVVGFKKEARTAHTSLIVSALVLLGGFFLRYVILYAGQLV